MQRCCLGRDRIRPREAEGGEVRWKGTAGNRSDVGRERPIRKCVDKQGETRGV